MERLFAAALAAAALAAALPAVSPGAPKPPYTASCALGGNTRADWQHVKLVDVQLTWTAPAGSDVVFQTVDSPVPSPTPPHGFMSTGTGGNSTAGVAPVSATFTFTRTDGSTDALTVPCA